MRIGIFTDTYPPFINGVSTSIISLEKALKEKGHQVFIVTVNPDDMSYKLEDEKTREREFSAFNELKDIPNKYIISLDKKNY